MIKVVRNRNGKFLIASYDRTFQDESNDEPFSAFLSSRNLTLKVG